MNCPDEKEVYLNLTRQFSVAIDELDMYDRLKISAIMQYFQDMAAAHAEIIGVGYEHMRSKNLMWVLSRLKAEIKRFPRFDEKISALTYPKKPGLADADRDYYIYGEDGETIITGTSKWCVLDIESRRIKRCAPLFAFTDNRFMPKDSVRGGCPPIPATEGEFSVVESDRVRYTDMDRNGHMNNARYGDIIMDAFPPEKLNASRYKGFEINFMSEIMQGDEYILCSTNCLTQSFFEAKDRNGNSIFRARVFF